MADSLFTAVPANDGTDDVLIRVDAQTALELAAAWDHTHLSIEVNALLRPLWWWDVAALRRAAADAVVHEDATTQTAPAETTRGHLRLVDLAVVKTS